MHGNIIHYLEYDSDWEGPAYVGANEVIGPGFAPFKPYLRPSYFFLRIVSFIIITLGGFLCVSTVLLIFPVLLGRIFMGYFGIMNPPDIYTSAIGLYLLWAGMRAVNAVLVKMSAGTKAIFFHVLTWLYQIIKCTIAAGILFFIIPILLGNLVNLFIISPIRVPINRTPVVYLSTEWALGLLHMKCSCGIIWLTNTAFKQTLDQLYQNGVRNISLSMIIMQVAWPVISYLILFITIPYVFFISTFYMTGLTLYSTSVNWYRYCYGVFFVILIALSAFLIIIKQSSHVYTSIRNKEYLIGRQLMNYGSIAKEEKTSYSVAVEETGHQD
jgi:E3 ubiquitin-protein ligase MARCH6